MDTLKVVTPVYEFINERTSLKFLNLLDYLATEKINLSDVDFNELVNQCELSVETDNLSLFDFDNKFWNLLQNFEISVNWWKYINVDDETEHTEPVLKAETAEEKENKLKLDVARNTLIEVIIEEQKEKDSYEHPLNYFNSVNQIFKSNKEFSKFIDSSNELAKLLIDKVVDKQNKKIKKGFDDKNWKWIYPNLCKFYETFLNHKNIDKENLNNFSKNTQASREIYCFSNLVILSLVAIHNEHNEIAFLGSLHELVNNCKFINKNNLLLQAFLAFIPKDIEKSESESESKLNGFDLEIFIRMNCLLMGNLDVFNFANSKANNLLSYSYLDQIDSDIFTGIKLKNDLIEEIACYPIAQIVRSFDQSLNLLPNRESLDQLNDFFNECIEVESLKEYLKFYTSIGIDDNFFKILYRKFHLEYLSFEVDWTEGIFEFSNYFVSELNAKEKQSNQIINSNLIESEDALFWSKCFPVFYSNFSTLAIALAEDEFYGENFFKTNPSNRFVEGAKTIFDAGFIDHSLVFLGYGLVRLSLGLVRGHSNFSVSLVNQFINDPRVWPRVEKYFLPFLDIIAEINPEINNECSIWIKSIKSRFNSSSLTLIDFTKSKEFQDSKNQILYPEWFSSEDIALKKSIDEYRNLSKLHEVTNWPGFYKNKGLRSTLNEIAQSLESVIVDLFKPIYMVIANDAKIKNSLDSFSSYSRESNFDKRMDLGWIEFFLKHLTRAEEYKPKELKLLIDQIKKYDVNLGLPLNRIKISNNNVVNSFAHFRILRNSLSHKDPQGLENNILALNDCNWLFDYATRDFVAIFKFFKK